jgi:hypothetical protein
MANENPDDDNEVRVFQPDIALKEKLGPNTSFDQVITSKVIDAAQDVIAKSSDEILATLKQELTRLQQITQGLKPGDLGEATLKPVIEAAFAIKSKAGLCGYSFASSLAKSLHVYCELDTVQTQPLTEKSLKIIQAQIAGLKTIFANKITGDGGAVGGAILGELQKLSESS